MDAHAAVVRRWSEADIPAIRQVLRDTWVAAYSSFIPEGDLHGYLDDHYSEKNFAELMRTPGVEGFVACVGEAVVGMVRMEDPKEGGRFTVNSLYVLPEFQRRGIGYQLLRIAEERGRGLGAQHVWLGVMEQNKDALAWYRSVGFTFIEEAPFTMGSTTINHLIGFRTIPTGNGVPVQ